MATFKPTYLTTTQPKAVAPYKPVENTVGDYTPIKNDVKAYTPGTYQSKYEGQLSDALNKVTNWSYDPLQDASYQALAKVYGARGNIAAKNTLADAAALNGGLQTSYAVSAAQQARNQYNQELAGYIPDLENAAYSRATGTLNALRGADDTDYGRFRDTEGDRQWKYTQDYQAYRDREADNQWRYSQLYQAYRDREADNQWLYNQNYQLYRDLLSDYQWGLNYNMDIYNMLQAEAAKASSGGGGGGRRRSGRSSGGGGGSYAPIINNNDTEDDVLPKKSVYQTVADGVLQTLQRKKTSSGGSGGSGSTVTRKTTRTTK